MLSKDMRYEPERFFHYSHDMLGIFNRQGVLLRINPAFERILGYSNNELADKPLLSLVYPEDKAETTGVINSGWTENKDYFMFENRCYSKDMNLRYLEWTCIPDKENGLCYAVIRDITPQKKNEKEAVRLDCINLLTEMANGIRLKVGNPLETVRGFLQLLTDKEELAEYKEYCHFLIEELDRADLIMSEFLSLGKNKISVKKVQSLNKLIKSIVPLLQADPNYAEKNIVCELADIPELLVNAREIRQVVMNLVTNGLEAVDKNGTVKISTYQDNNSVVIEVSDNGPGIEKDIMAKLGKPFTTTKEKGAGLGLTICYNLARKNNAVIEVETGGEGSTFYVRFNLPENNLSLN